MGMSDPIELVDYLNNKKNGHVDIFYIPPYQRPYEWTWGRDERRDAAYKLYKDIETGSITQMGIILLHRDRDREQINVIDGQQRLITFSLFIKALLTLKKGCIQNDANLGMNAVQRLQTCLCQLNNDLEPTPNLRLQLSAVNSFKEGAIFGDIIRGDGEPKPDPKSSYEKVYKGVYESLEKLSDEEISRFTKNLSKTKIWALEVEDKKLAWEVFQTLNGTGKPLDAADFIKGQLYDEVLKSPSAFGKLSETNLALDFKNKWEAFINCLEGEGGAIKVKKSNTVTTADELLQFYSRVSPLHVADKVGEDIVSCFSNENWQLIKDTKAVFANFNAIETFFKIVGSDNVADLSHQKLTPTSKICLWILKNINSNFKFYMPIFVFWALDPNPYDLETFLKGMVAYWTICNIRHEDFKSDKQKEDLIRVIDSIYEQNIVDLPVDSNNSSLPSFVEEKEIGELLKNVYRYDKPKKDEIHIKDQGKIKTLLRIYSFLVLENCGNNKDAMIHSLENYTDADHIIPQSLFKAYTGYGDEMQSGNSIGNIALLTKKDNGAKKGEKTEPQIIIEIYRASLNPDAKKVADEIEENLKYQRQIKENEISWWTNINITDRAGKIAQSIAQWCKDSIEKANKITFSEQQKEEVKELKEGKAFHTFPLQPLSWKENWTRKNVIYFELKLEEESISRSVSDLTEAFTAIAGILNARFDLSKRCQEIGFLAPEQKDAKWQPLEGSSSLWIDTNYDNEYKRNRLQKLIKACNMQEDDLILYTV